MTDRAVTAPPGTKNPPNRAAGAARGFLGLLVVPCVLVFVWAIVAALLDSLVFPGPLQAAEGLIDDLQRPAYQESVITSIRLLIISWVLAAVVGALVGFVLGQSQFWSKVFQTPLFALYSIPKVTLYPVFLLLLGLGEPSRIVFAFLHGVFPVALLVMGATATMDTKLVRLADALKLTWWQRVTKIVLPALLPTVLVALRISFGLTFLGLVLAEMFSADIGLGRELVNNVANVRIEQIAGQVLFIGLLALGPVLAMLAVERRVKARVGIR
ncbi:ABC transporter permease [Mycolicibacterium sp. S2-37]|uniref:ABC transporter permease n=1 Tax=Mycolicibacterium sp. S2-37 TaxID=2810297 RepID=UPI001A944E8A|nr:ABC transporter permease subunit [Mycolicibacterium sp. S2-37]